VSVATSVDLTEGATLNHGVQLSRHCLPRHPRAAIDPFLVTLLVSATLRTCGQLAI
jgi:hypothetical protein